MACRAVVMTKVNKANTIVMVILPVKFAPPGKNGTKPKRLFRKIKKKIVSKKGVNFKCFFSPIAALAISSLIKIIIGSMADCSPFGACPSRLL